MEVFDIAEGVSKSIIENGNGDIPHFTDGTKITFNFETHLLDESRKAKHQIDNSQETGRPMELIIGKQFKMTVWEECLKTMKIGEKSEFIAKKKLVDSYPLVSKSYREYAGLASSKKGNCCGMMAFSNGIGHSDLDALIHDPQDLLFKLEMLKAEHPGEYEKEAWSMNSEEKLQKTLQLKESGNKLYKEQCFDDSAKKYFEALGLIEQLLLREKPGDSEWQELDHIKTPILLNYAQCKLLQKDYYPVIQHTSDVLEKDKVNSKALYRRAKAYIGTWDLDLAREDLLKLAEVDSSSKGLVQRELKNIAVLQKQKDNEIKSKLCGKAFGDAASN